jgi:catechol 2,3-dioxygenase-like lactoylglutathione lyase family enzyme
MTDQAGSLHDRLNRISHWDVNVTDLERSRSWYEATTTLRVVARTKASQSFPGFGIESGSFKGYLLKDANLPRGVPMIHLVQWENPAPVGTPYRSQANVGWYRICPIVDDIETTRGAVIAQGSKPFAPTTRAKVSFHPATREIDYRVFTVHDPDGVAVEFVDKLVMGSGGFTQVPAAVAHNTANVEKFFPFYHELLAEGPHPRAIADFSHELIAPAEQPVEGGSGAKATVEAKHNLRPPLTGPVQTCFQLPQNCLERGQCRGFAPQQGFMQHFTVVAGRHP